MTDRQLREQVREVYSAIATEPGGSHPVRVGRALALRAGYSDQQLATVPPASVDAFAGVSCLPCFVEIAPEARALDLGCGAGLDTILIATSAGSVLGVDFSEEMLSLARASASKAGTENAEFRLADAEAIPVDSASFDFAVVNGIFNLNPMRPRIFAELARAVRPGGMVFAAELTLKAPLPADQRNRADWFA
jgi:arsenite methyltransferase